jgi:hypothetical protein
LILELKIPDSIPLDPKIMVEFKSFLQAVVNRKCVGVLRYGNIPDKRKRYLTRLKKELLTYKTTGNFEQLLNIAVYCFLESYAPENKKFHFDPKAASVTRKEMGL